MVEHDPFVEPVRRGAVIRPLSLLGAPRTLVIILWTVVLACQQVLPFFWYGAGVIAFGFVTHLCLRWVQRKHPFADEVFMRLIRGNNGNLVP